MLIECLKGQPISVDGRNILQDIRINIAGNNQLRTKLTYLGEDGNAIPYDIVVYNYTVPKMEIDNMSISVFIKGEEYQRRIPCSFKIEYHFMQKKWKVRGDINRQPFEYTVKSAKDVVQLIDKMKVLFDIK